MFVWDVHPILDLGFTQVRWYSIWFVVGLLCVWNFGSSAYARRGMPSTYVPQLIMVFTVGIILGGHLLHMVLYEPQALLENPARIFEVGNGMASHGSFLGILAGAALWCRFKGESLLRVADASAVAWFWLFPFVRLGNFFNSEIYGLVTEMPWGVVFVHGAEAGADPRHPVQLYEAAFNTFLIVFSRCTDTKPDQFAPGVRAAVLIGLYCFGRFFIEFFKEYQVMSSSALLNMGQMMSIFGLFVCGTTAFILAWRRRPECT